MMFGIFAALAAAASPTAGETVSEVARLTAGPCFSLASQSIPVPAANDIEATQKLVEGFGLEYGIAGATFNRLKPAESGALNRATMGSKQIGDDALVLAVGGQVPGCMVMWLTHSGESREYELVDALVAEGWREPQPGVAQQRGVVGKRMLVRRDEAGNPYLVHVLTIMQPGSELRHVTTLVKIPPRVKLPEGF